MHTAFIFAFLAAIATAAPNLSSGPLTDSNLERRYERGECNVTITQYQKNPLAPPGDNSTRYRFDVNITDSTGYSVGNVTKAPLDTSSNPIIPGAPSDADGYIVVKGELPYPFIIDPLPTVLIFRYGFQSFASSSEACTWQEGVNGREDLGDSLKIANATGVCQFLCAT